MKPIKYTTLRVSPEVLKNIKINAAIQGITIAKYMEKEYGAGEFKKIMERMKKENNGFNFF